MILAIIGSGLAGLSAALECKSRNIDFLLFESTSSIGGKLKTINCENFQLDLGFQVLLGAYPSIKEIMKQVDTNILQPCYFEPGALFLKNGKVYCLSDPLRDCENFFRSLTCPLVSFTDKILTLFLKLELSFYSFNDILKHPRWSQQSSLEYLQEKNFSEQFIGNFAKPFFGGVFGDSSLQTKASCLAFAFKAFSEERVFIPANGVQELPKAMLNFLNSKNVYLDTPVSSIQRLENKLNIMVENGNSHIVDGAIVSTDLEACGKLLGETTLSESRVTYFNLYFTSTVSLYEEKKIFLNCNKNKIINNGVQISNISDKLSPATDQHLISVTVLNNTLNEAELIQACLDELEDLFPKTKGQLQFLKLFELKGSTSLLNQQVEESKALREFTQKLKQKLPSNVFLAGEFLTENCSQETAIQSGKQAVVDLLRCFK
jgi:protoporphyrinogen oxidase